MGPPPWRLILPGTATGQDKIPAERIILLRTTVYRLTKTAVIAALYVALCLLFAPLSFGAAQLRLSEALTLLPVIFPEAVIGVTLGCFIANAIASAPVDMLVGTLATLLAALCTYRLRGRRFRGLALAAALPPILINAVAIGCMLTLLYMPGAGMAGCALNIAGVGLGQAVSCGVLGVALVYIIEKSPAALRLLRR